METLDNFRAIKEKIIKTDELLRMYTNKKHEADEAAKKLTELSVNYEKVQQEVTRLNLEVERSSHSSSSSELRYSQLEKQYHDLNKKHTLLELDFQEEIGKMQTKFQESCEKLAASQAQLKASNDKNDILCTTMAQTNAEEINNISPLKIKQEKQTAKKNCNWKRLVFEEQTLHPVENIAKKEIKTSQENIEKPSEKHKALYKEIFHLKNEVKQLKTDLENVENTKEQLKDLNKIKAENAKLTKKFDNLKKKSSKNPKEFKFIELELNQKSKELQDINDKHSKEIAQINKKHNSAIQRLEEKLVAISIEKFEMEQYLNDQIMTLNATLEEYKKGRSIWETKKKQLDVPVISFDSDSDSVTDILAEMKGIPGIISPLSEMSDEDNRSENMSIPEIIITPPFIDNNPQEVDFYPEVEPMVTDITPSPPRKTKIITNVSESEISTKNRFEERRITKQKRMKRILENKKRRIKLLSQQRNQLNNKQLLQRTINSDNLNVVHFNDINVPNKPLSDTLDQKHCSETLLCRKSCKSNQNYMLLLNDKESELLGFSNDKNEINTYVNPSTKISYLPPANQAEFETSLISDKILSTLAELVKDKINSKDTKRKTKKKVAKKDSETEPESTLINKENVLTRNKMLLQKAKEENLFMDSETEIESKFNISKSSLRKRISSHDSVTSTETVDKVTSPEKSNSQRDLSPRRSYNLRNPKVTTPPSAGRNTRQSISISATENVETFKKINNDSGYSENVSDASESFSNTTEDSLETVKPKTSPEIVIERVKKPQIAAIWNIAKLGNMLKGKRKAKCTNLKQTKRLKTENISTKITVTTTAKVPNSPDLLQESILQDVNIQSTKNNETSPEKTAKIPDVLKEPAEIEMRPKGIEIKPFKSKINIIQNVSIKPPSIEKNDHNIKILKPKEQRTGGFKKPTRKIVAIPAQAPTPIVSTISEVSEHCKISIVVQNGPVISDVKMEAIPQRTGGFKRPNVSKIVPECPRSPSPEPLDTGDMEPVIIPLEKPKRMNVAEVDEQFEKLLNFGNSEDYVEEVVKKFINQDSRFIAGLIVDEVSCYKHQKPEKGVGRAPMMTNIQRILLGFMSLLEKNNVNGLFEHFLDIAEMRLLTSQTLEGISQLSRLYIAVCKMKRDVFRIRKFCCEAFFFMGDLAVPLFFTVLTSWIEVFPLESNSKDNMLVKTIVEIINLKNKNMPGYNLIPLRDLLKKYYGYAAERTKCEDFFKEMFNHYLQNPVRPSDLIILLYCKNTTSKWVHKQIEDVIIPVLGKITKDNFKATVIILVGNIVKSFNKIEDWEYVEKTKAWLESLLTEDLSDVIKRSIERSIQLLPKDKPKIS